MSIEHFCIFFSIFRIIFSLNIKYINIYKLHIMNIFINIYKISYAKCLTSKYLSSSLNVKRLKRRRHYE